MYPIAYADVLAARSRLRPFFDPSPVRHYPQLDELVGYAPAGVIEFVQKDDPTVIRMLALKGDIFPDYGESAFESALAPLSDALAVNALARAPRAYARTRMLSSLGFAGASVLAGLLYNRTGFAPASIFWAVDSE